MSLRVKISFLLAGLRK